MSDRAALVAAARDTIAQGSQSFAAASKLFAPATRERAWLLYAWCRAADDMTDGQELGHGASALDDPAAAQARLEALTALALYSGEEVPLPFAALRAVAHETAMPARFIEDHLAGFALDAAGWQPQSGDDLLRYCYHVAGTVGCMMAVVMGVSPQDEDTLDRACDLGLAFQLANIARDVVPDAHAGRCYLPAEWLDAAGLDAGRLADPQALPALAALAARLVEMARPYRRSARVGAARLPGRSRLAVLAADAIYGTIGEKVLARGTHAWDERVRVSGGGKILLLGQAMLRSLSAPEATSRDGLWTRPRQS
ncbi:MAG: phytoene/squalene synthase family protein [Novosphingobium sp.]|nr:phytoene/squalene synthase family protein [Novosphingobium sp.]